MEQPRHALSRRTLLRGAATAAGLAMVGELTGCSSGASSGSDSVTPTGPALKLPSEVTAGPLPAKYVGPRARDLKPFGEGRTVRVAVPQDAAIVGDWSSNKATQWFEKRTGLKVEFSPVLVTNAQGETDLTKVNAMLAGGDLPDAFLGIPFTQSQLSLYGQQGVFRPLNELIDAYAPATRDLTQQFPDMKTLKTASDGNLYTMVGMADCFHCRSSNGRAFISQAYLDNVGMPMPTTTDGLRQVLLEFKNKNPSGKPGFLPLAGAANQPIDTFIMNAFEYNPGKFNQWLRLNNGKVEFTANTDGWREALKYLNQLGRDGIITDRTFTMTAAELQQAGNTGRIGFTRAYYWGSFFNPINPKPDAAWRSYVAVPPLKGPRGVQYAAWDYYYGFNTPGLQITKKAERPEDLVRWADYMLDLESVMWLYYGEKGTNWDYAKKGDKGITGQQAIFKTLAWPPPAGEAWTQKAVTYLSADFRTGQAVDPRAPTFEIDLYRASQKYQQFAQPREMQLPPVIIQDADAATIADAQVSISQHVTTSLAQFSLGQKDPNKDEDWKAYVDALQRMNLQAYLDIYQKAYEKRPK